MGIVYDDSIPKPLFVRRSKQVVCESSCGSTSVAASATVEGLAPNERAYARMAAEDENANGSEHLTSATLQFSTPSAPPRIVGAPEALFAGPTSVIVFGELNPENSQTEYFFEYWPAVESCAPLVKEPCNAARTASLSSSSYGAISALVEIKGLQSATNYDYRLGAVNERGEAPMSTPVGQFTTTQAPKVEAQTGTANTIGTTSATVTGMVDPDGQAATYVFELGVDRGPDTQYGVVLSGPVPASSAPVAESLGLTGLQPGVTYAYRITVRSGYGESVGTPMTFTTQGLPTVLNERVSLELLRVPSIAIPHLGETPSPRCKQARGRRKSAHRCVRARKTPDRKPAHKKPRARRHAKGPGKKHK